MSKKDYLKAVKIVQGFRQENNYLDRCCGPIGRNLETGFEGELIVLIDGFVQLFKDNPRFDENKFRAACRGAR